MKVTRAAEIRQTNYTRTRFYSALGFCSLGLVVYLMAAVAFSQELAPASDLLPETLKQLSSKDASSRRNAAAELGQTNDFRAVPGLIRALRDSDPFVRAQAADSLKFLRARQASSELTRLLVNDPEVRVRQAASQALAQIADPKTTPVLIQCLKDPEDKVRYGCIKALGVLRDPTAVAPLSELANDPNSHLAGQALSALGSIESSEAKEVVKSKLEAKDPRIQSAACWASARQHDDAGMQVCIKLLSSQDAKMRLDAANALRLMGDGRAEAALQKALEKEREFTARRMMGMALERVKERTARGGRGEEKREKVGVKGKKK